MAEYPLQGRTLFITGGASGIGAETARQAAQRGARVALVDVDGAAAKALAGALPDAIGIEADVRDYASIEHAVAQTLDAFGGIDVVMANAGVEVGATARSIPLADLERIADVNFTGVFRTVRATAGHVIDRGGYILITASLAALAHTPPLSHYAATKAGVEAFGNGLRIELAHKGVGVGVAYFSFIDTPMVARGKADPILAEFEASGPGGPLAKTYPVSGAGKAVVRGIERRARRVVYPGFLRGAFAFRPGLPRLMERVLPRRNVGPILDKLDARDLHAAGETSPSHEHQEQLLS